ncbi:hypothetical protein DL98DRAFT_435965 [Cadophora sp. DSE1049]|nr:hypothetical protein DL98DRAFT_435965 [Cadophora sp. DSE1049]
MAKRTADLTWFPENHGERELPPRKQTARPPAPVLYKASIKELAETGTIRVTASTAAVDDVIILRIKKCLERANHPNTLEAEAKAAIHLASRLMGRYNYAGQSIVSMQRVDGDKSKPVKYQSYANDLCHAMICFFDCDFYSVTTYSTLELVFYGIAENTVAAAMSFEMTYNLIAEWARPYKGIGSKNSYSLGVAEELCMMAEEEKVFEEAQAKKAERDGITAEVKKEEAEKQAQLARLAPFPKAPNKLSSPEPATNADASAGINDGPAVFHDDACNTMCLDSEGTEDDEPKATPDSLDRSGEDDIEPDFKVEDEYDVNFGDLDDEISRLIKPEQLSSKASLGRYSRPPAPTSQSNIPSPLWKREPAPASSAKIEQKSSEPQELELEVESKWASHMQLVTFRATATKIADRYLEEKGIRLRRQSARSIVIRDWDAYDQGVRDGKKIDVRRKRLEN